jgi:hypothetical protein
VSNSITERLRIETDGITSAAGLIFRSIESYLQELIKASVRSQLQSLGITVNPTETSPASSVPIPGILTVGPVPSEGAGPAERQIQSNRKNGIAEAIEAYLKDIKPPQREQKTYDEYRLVLYKFRDNCEKKYLQDINRDDCLGFMRHLYSIGNEARTVFNRMGIVEQLLRLHGITGLLKRRDKPKYVANVREMYQPEEGVSSFALSSSLTARLLGHNGIFSGPDAVKVPLNLEVLVIGLLTSSHKRGRSVKPSFTQALACQQANFDFSLIEPTAVFGCCKHWFLGRSDSCC